MKLAPLSHRWLREVLAQDPTAVRHHTIRTGDGLYGIRLVLTAGTSELQRFLTMHLQTPEAWKDEFVPERESVTNAAFK